MKKLKIIFLVALIFSLALNTNVFAQCKTFVNKNNVELTEREYQFVNQFYGENFFDNMTQEDYEWILDLDVEHNDFEINNSYYYDNDKKIHENSKGQSYSTNSKMLNIAKACTNNVCTIITKLAWLVNPNNRSYDVIGERLYNTSLYNNTVTTRVSSSAGIEFFSNNKFLSNGVGTSVKLPENATNISVQQKIYVYPGGTVYGSYQHSISPISLQTSTWYTMSATGYGGVFLFYNGAENYYDGMGGVNINP